MSGTLDSFLPPQVVKSKPTSIAVEETCAKCGNKIPLIAPKYRLKIKGEEKPYCQDCARKIMSPQKEKKEETEEKDGLAQASGNPPHHLWVGGKRA